MEKLADDFPDEQQRAAVCYRTYREANAMPKINARVIDDDDDDDTESHERMDEGEDRRKMREHRRAVDDDEEEAEDDRREGLKRSAKGAQDHDDEREDREQDREREWDKHRRRGGERSSQPGNGYTARKPRSWFQMRAKGDKAAEIMIYDEIGPGMFGGGLSAKDFHQQLNALGKVKEITLRINSPGGNVFDALAIHNMLKAHPARITARIDGIAASAASLIAMAGDKITMPKNGFLMLHKPQAMVMGDVDDMKAMAADLARMTKVFAQCYSGRCGKKTAREMTELMAESRLMDATEAMAFGLTDEVSDPIKMTACFDVRKLPTRAAQARIKAEFTVATGWGAPKQKDEDEDEETVELGSPNPFDDNGLIPVDENGLMVPAQKPGHGVEESYETGFNTPPFNDLGSEPEDLDDETSSLNLPRKDRRKMKAEEDDFFGTSSPGDAGKATKKVAPKEYDEEEEGEEDDDLFGEGAVSTERASKASRKAVEALRVAAGVQPYGRKQMKETMELCALAGVSAKVAHEFIANKTPVAQVRRELMDRRVLRDAETRIMARQPAYDAARSEKVVQDSWAKVISDVNARVAMPEVGKTMIDR
jgi:ATP-dependent protease ClpP protease subunit